MNNKLWLVLLISLMFLTAFVFAENSVDLEDSDDDSNRIDDGYNSNDDINLDPDFIVGNDRDSYGCIPSAGYSWCEEKQKCLRTWEESCDATFEESCVCTMEYAPVCGKNGVTYGNKCAADCGKVEVDYVGECESEDEDEIEDNEDSVIENNFCGGIAGVQCKEGYLCRLDGDYPDAGGKCIYDCPEYMPPLCEGDNVIVGKIDERGCKRPVCLSVTSTVTTSQSDFYLGANWVCSNGEEFKEKSEKCMPAAYWKETARKTCAQFSVECDSNRVPQKTNVIANRATGNFILDIAVATLASTSNTTTARQTPQSASCVKQMAYVHKFEFAEKCEVNCEVFIDSEGCKNINCNNGKENEIKRYCPNECYKQSSEEISKLKEKCYAVDGQLIVKTNEQGCTKYFCDRLIQVSDSDSNLSESFVNSSCTLLDELPKEKYANCEMNGGKLLVKTNQDNCITVLECVGVKDNVQLDANIIVNKEIIKDQVQLLSIALKLEELKIELIKTAAKVQGISDYYQTTGDINSQIKFQNAVDLLKIASNEIDAIKEMIKERANNFTENDALEVKKAVKSIKSEILNKVLMVLLD